MELVDLFRLLELAPSEILLEWLLVLLAPLEMQEESGKWFENV